MPEMKKEILSPAAFLAEKLRAKKMTLREFVKESGLTHEVAYEIFQGERKINYYTAHKIAQVFGTTTKVLMNLEKQYQRSKENDER